METMPFFYINEILVCNFTTTFNIIDQYQRKYPALTDKLTSNKYKRGLFHGGRNNVLNHMTCNGKYFITLKLKR